MPVVVATWLSEGGAELARTLWDEGLPARQIAARVGHGATKSAIVGYAQRKRWPPRPSPIGRQTEAKPRVPLRPSRKPPAAPKPVPRPKLAPAPRLPAAPTAPLPSGCQWIPTDCLGRPWRFCGAATLPSSPWCAVHRARVYMPRRLLVAA